MPPTPSDEAARGGGALTTTLLFVVTAAAAVQVAFTVGTSRRLASLEERLAAPPKPPEHEPARGEGTLDEKVDAVRADLEFLVNDIQRLQRTVDDLSAQLENRGAVRTQPEQPPDLDWTQPELFDAARRGAESCGFTLTRDELRVPARLVLREGLVEYFAVLKGGKEHETVFSIVGNTPPDARRPKDMGVKLSNALQALGFRRGRPIQIGPSGTTPAQGETVHVYAEWETGGRTEVVRTEDLVWHRDENRPMRPGAWVYVGSQFVEGDGPTDLDYLADLTAEAMATYSSPGAIVDNVDAGAQDDTVFLVATPRIPLDVDHCTLVFRKQPLAAVKEFPAVPAAPPGEPRDGGQGGEKEQPR